MQPEVCFIVKKEPFPIRNGSFDGQAAFNDLRIMNVQGEYLAE